MTNKKSDKSATFYIGESVLKSQISVSKGRLQHYCLKLLSPALDP